MIRIPTTAAMVAALFLSLPAQAQDKPLLTLPQALDEAAQHSPRIQAADAAVKAADGGLKQASALPNPEIGVEGENLAGSGPYSGTQSAEFTYGLAQQIELGGKRSAREMAAKQEHMLSQFTAASTRLDVARDVKQAFAEVVVAQESLKLAEDNVAIAQQEMKSVARRVAEAASPLIQQSKAEVSLATAEFDREQARETHQVARKRLATLLGREDALTETLDASRLYVVAQPTAPSEDALKQTPDMLRLHAQESRATALLDIEKAGAIPDPTVSLGVRQFRDTSDKAFVLGLSIPIPVFNANSGNISRARAEVAQASGEQHLARLELLQKFTETKAALNTAYEKATRYSKRIVPASEKAFKLARQGYGAGKFQYLEVLDAQRTMFDARNQYLTALRDYHSYTAELERLTTPYTITGETHAN